MIKYRIMIPSDYDKVSIIWRSIDGMGLRSLDDSREGIEKYLARNPSTSFIAEEGEKTIGCILCGHDGRRGYIYHACVLHEYRRKGVGTQLLNLACNSLKSEGINKCALVCFASNESGNSFWNSKNWEHRTDLNYFNFSLNENNK